MKKETAETIILWLEDDKESALTEDSSVGIFPLPEVAEGIDELINYLKNRYLS